MGIPFLADTPVATQPRKAVAESTKQAGVNIKAATAKEPSKSVNKGKAHIHKAKAHAHGHAVKADTNASVK